MRVLLWTWEYLADTQPSLMAYDIMAGHALAWAIAEESLTASYTASN